MNVLQSILKILISWPIFNRFSSTLYSLLGATLMKNSRISPNITVIGSYKNIKLNKNAEINAGCFLLAKEKIIIGMNSTLAYQVTILTSANPNGPYNELEKIYPAMKAPVFIGDNVWIGARAIIFPGITIGNFSVVAAGSIVNHDVPDYSVVAGVPAKIIKRIDPKRFQQYE